MAVGVAVGYVARNPWLGASVALAGLVTGLLWRRFIGWWIAELVVLSLVIAITFVTSSAQELHTGQPWTRPYPTYACGSVLSATNAVRHQWLVAGGNRLFLHCKEALSGYRQGAVLALALGAVLLALASIYSFNRRRRVRIASRKLSAR